MDKTVMEFINTGKSFRASKNSQRVIILEKDACTRMCMKHWADKLGRVVQVSSNYATCDAMICEKPAILLIGVDGQDPLKTVLFLDHINDKHTASFVIVYTKCANLAHQLQTDFPRISTIVRGEGMDALLHNIEDQVPKRSAS